MRNKKMEATYFIILIQSPARIQLLAGLLVISLTELKNLRFRPLMGTVFLNPDWE